MGWWKAVGWVWAPGRVQQMLPVIILPLKASTGNLAQQDGPLLCWFLPAGRWDSPRSTWVTISQTPQTSKRPAMARLSSVGSRSLFSFGKGGAQVSLLLLPLREKSESKAVMLTELFWLARGLGFQVMGNKWKQNKQRKINKPSPLTHFASLLEHWSLWLVRW